ncbi:MAG: 2-oxoacid:acceptor oxidoreductase family protein [Nitrospirae bacterium]|nr:2-oxoacid:acceptor oxidoreductase family protein [Nitrospirota bacterium]MCL5238346.1 2-oxoacid:acceptor oxidoreductase family protein [Nitrospirota bacterium]
MEKRIIIAGSGGQGVLFLGKLMAYSAMLEGKEVTWFPSYGAEMRGGTANCTVIISDEMIGSPVTGNPDILIVMNEASYNRFSKRLLPGGLLFYDSSLITADSRRDDVKILKVPASEMSASPRHTKSANMVMMGAFITVTGLLALDSALSAIGDITPSRRKDSIAVNKDLITKGYGLIETEESNSIGHQAHT